MEQKSHSFWREMRTAVKAAYPDAPLLGEFWRLIWMERELSREKVDLPYVLVNSDLEGGGLSQKYESLRVGYIVPFCEELDRPKDAIRHMAQYRRLVGTRTD